MDIDKLTYYVYGLVDPRSNEVFYIGKGQGKRAESHLKEVLIEGRSNYGKINRIRDIQRDGFAVSIYYYVNDVPEEAAYMLEEILIDRIGRKILKYGPLENWLVGGVNEDKNKLSLGDDQKISIDYAISKYPYLDEIIRNVKRTTKEDEIRVHFRETVTEVINAITILDPEILELIEASNIRFLDHPLGKAIQFECKYGWGEIALETKEDDHNLRRATIYLRKDKNILFKTIMFSNQYESIKQLREFITT